MAMDSFDVNSEAYFNEKLHLWLTELSDSDLRRILEKWLSIPLSGVMESARIRPWDSSDPAFTSFGRFDQKIDFGKFLCVILELKVGTEATIGQLRKYLEYINTAGYRRGYVVLLSRNTLAQQKLGYGVLKQEYPGLLFVTWESLEKILKSMALAKELDLSQSKLDNFIELLTFLTDQHKRSERLLDQPSPWEEDLSRILSALKPAATPKKKDSLLVWTSRSQFWNEVLDVAVAQLKTDSWCAFRFDLYDWMIRWAFAQKRVFLDIYEDKNYEYYYHAFFSEVYPGSKGLPSAQLSDMYYRLLLIRDDNEYLKTKNHRIFFHAQGKRVYFFALADSWKGEAVPYVQLFNHRFG
jgi:hypothetical protein